MIQAAVYSFAHGWTHAAELASALGLNSAGIDVHGFPDGESLVCVPSGAATSILYCPLDRPNGKLVNLMLAADALRRQGAGRLILVAPYLCYMRQDKVFHEGEAVSQQAVARFLSSLFDKIVTVDAHLHRVSSITRVFPEIEAVNLLAAKTIARFAAGQGMEGDTLVVGPDEESAQWVKKLAENLGAESLTGRKTRQGDRDVQICFAEGLDLEGRNVLLADDIVSSGGTMISAIAAMKARGAASVRVAVTHALFDEQTHRGMLSAGANAVWSTTSVPHPTTRISLAGLLAEALREDLHE